MSARGGSAGRRDAWSRQEGDVNDAFQASTFGSKASLQGGTFDSGPDGGLFLPDSNKIQQLKQQEEEVQDGCWWKFMSGVKAMWKTTKGMSIESHEDKEMFIKTTLRELVVYLIFLTVLCVLTFGMTSSTMYYYTKVMSELFLDSSFPVTKNTFRGINHPFEFWTFAEGPMLDGLYWETWYNGRNLTNDEEGYIYYESKLLGVPRLRQIRVKNNTCTLDPNFEGEVKGCYGEYKSSREFTGSFGPGNTSAWEYQSADDIDGSGHNGQLAFYEGGGFTQNLRRKKSESMAVIQDLKQNLWIDRATRVVFADFTVYNANINLFCVVRFVIEFPATGGALPSSDFRTVKLIRYVTVWDYVIMACECVFVLFTIYYTVEELVEIRAQKLKYFTQFWNVLDVFVMTVSYVLIAFSVYRTVRVNALLDSLLQNPEEFADFEYLAYWQNQFNNAVALAVFFAWIKIFKYISFNKTMTQLSATLSRCSKDLVGFLIMFLIMFFAFAQLGNMMFGNQVDDFRTMFQAVFTLFRIILGDFDFHALEKAHFIFGPVYFFLYVFFIFFVLLNMFLAIINDTYSDVKGDESLQENEFEVGDYFKKGYERMLEKLNFKKNNLSDLQLTLAGADVNGDNHLEFSEWRNDLKKKGYADTEIEALFAKYDTDGDRILDPEEQKCLAEDLLRQKDSLNAEYAKIQKDAAEGEPPAALADLMDSDDEGEKRAVVDDGVPYEEYAVLARRVDRMEHSIGSIVSKIDAVLIKLDTMEKAKSRRKETMSRLLDSIIEGNEDNLTEEDKKRQMENLVAEELARWDEDVMNSSNSDLGTAHSRILSAASVRSSPGSGRDKGKDFV